MSVEIVVENLSVVDLAYVEYATIANEADMEGVSVDWYLNSHLELQRMQEFQSYE
jgi:hypothetical protein